MGIIRDWIDKHVISRELTPKGECFFDYVLDLSEGRDVSIEPYDDDIEKIRQICKDELGVEITTEDTIDLLSAYYSEYFS